MANNEDVEKCWSAAYCEEWEKALTFLDFEKVTSESQWSRFIPFFRRNGNDRCDSILDGSPR